MLPIGVHPVFKLPDEPGAARLSAAGDIAVHTYPVDAEMGVSKLPHATRFSSLDKACLADGTAIDLSRHPLPMHTEEIVLVSGVEGRASLDNHEEGYRASILWDIAAFGSCNLWISHYGRTGYPWNGRFKGLGIEPVSAPFDLGCAVATTPTLPLLAEGVTCGVQFHAGKVWTTHYAIEVEPLATT